jgi:hypothetical protein
MYLPVNVSLQNEPSFFSPALRKLARALFLGTAVTQGSSETLKAQDLTNAPLVGLAWKAHQLTTNVVGGYYSELSWSASGMPGVTGYAVYVAAGSFSGSTTNNGPGPRYSGTNIARFLVSPSTNKVSVYGLDSGQKYVWTVAAIASDGMETAADSVGSIISGKSPDIQRIDDNTAFVVAGADRDWITFGDSTNGIPEGADVWIIDIKAISGSTVEPAKPRLNKPNNLRSRNGFLR